MCIKASRAIASTVLMSIFLCGAVFADGKFFYPDEVSSDLPYQRAAIYYVDGIEMLLVQSRYEAEIAGDEVNMA